MTYTRNDLKTLIGNAQTAYRQWHTGELQRSTLDRVEMDLYDYVESLLAEKNAEIKRLEANQITPEMLAIYQDFLALESSDPDGTVYPSEESRLHREMWQAVCKVIDPTRWGRA